MEEDKPWALVVETGFEVYPDEFVDLIREHFRIVLCSELQQNHLAYGPKIQAVFLLRHSHVPSPSLFQMLPSLKVVVCSGAGVDHLDLPFFASLEVKVANTPDDVSDATADLAMALLLASARRIVEGHQIALDPKTVHMPQNLMGVEVTGSTLGIIGMGRTGFKIAQRSKGFDLKILYHSRTRRIAADEMSVGAIYCKNIDDLLKMSDFVMVVVTLTADTKGLIGARELALMKPTATLVNVSRGSVVDQDALAKALQNGTIHAAALDVTHPEPLPRDHPLLSLPNVLITPHIGADTHRTARRVVQRMVANAVAAVNGLPVPNEVKSQ